MNTERVLSLQVIPRLIFGNFSDLNSVLYEQFKYYAGLYTVALARAKIANSNSPFVLVCREGACGNSCPAELALYDYEAKLEQFGPSGHTTKDPILKIIFGYDNPSSHKYENQHSHWPRPCDVWEKGKGFWVREYLKMSYCGDGSVDMTSSFEDYEFGFFLELQQCAHRLAQKVLVRGRWEKEWYPEIDYSVPPE